MAHSCPTGLRWLVPCLSALALLTAPAVHAASTGTTGLYMPQGDGAGTANGDYITATGGLNTFYRYFIEVPSGQSRLVVDIFDADVGQGGTTEDDAGRDRSRDIDGDGVNFDSTATYTLVNPAGATRNTQFTTGNTTSPTGAENAWLSLFDSTGDTVRDNFGTAAFTNNNGTVNWAANWTETNDDASAAAGVIQIIGGELRIRDDGGGASTIHREANLSGAGFGTATFSFNLRTENVEAGDQMRVEVSANGGGSWTTLETFTGTVAATTRSYDITSSIATNTRIRFIEVGGYTGTDSFFVDNVQIQETNIDNGHWELRVSMTGASDDDDINAIGIRAHDGTSGSGGTELNVYYDSQNQFGVNPASGGTANSRTYAFYPYLTSGCSARESNFDFDAASTNNTSSGSYTSRDGSFAHNVATASLSGQDVWDGTTFTGWTSDTLSTGYGLWTGGLTITTYTTPAINGNYANEWLSNFQVASDTPGANPTTNAFRVYLPTDAGAAPSKAYVEQLATFSGCGLSGPNPPVVGQTSCFTVTVRVTNPEAQAITFSASNLVTANVPGSGAVYAGTAQVSQGSIVSQPSVGGTGNITWNPGTVAAGGTALLAYRVNVTPTSAGQRIPLTATPASGNGTRAQYVDNTGNTTQTRATYLFGPLCELAVTQGLLTPAVVASVRASAAAGGGVLVEWQTAAETGTAGFNLYRRDPATRKLEKLNRELLAALVGADQGGTYRFLDEGASAAGIQVYRIEEIAADGGRRNYGPYRVAVERERPELGESLSSYERTAHAATRPAAVGDGGDDAFASLTATTAKIKPASVHGAHLSVRQTGLYYASTAEVAAWLGLTAEKASKMIVEGKLSLSRDGVSVAYYPDPVSNPGKAGGRPTAQGLFFYAEGGSGIYSTASVYRLQAEGRGLFMATVGAGATTPPASGGNFGAALHQETDSFPATVISPDPESDYWFWEFLQGDDPSFGVRTFGLDAPGVVPGAGGTLTVSLQGATASGISDEHDVVVALNGTELGRPSGPASPLTRRASTCPPASCTRRATSSC